MLKHSIALLFVIACTESTSTTSPQLTGDSCAFHIDDESCVADAACVWYGIGAACPDDGTFCPGGVCQAADGGGGGGGGGGGSSAGCACPDSGVCFVELGGPGSDDQPDDIQCTTPAPGDDDPCARIVDHGACTASTTVDGLCICDDGTL